MMVAGKYAPEDTYRVHHQDARVFRLCSEDVHTDRRDVCTRGSVRPGVGHLGFGQLGADLVGVGFYLHLCTYPKITGSWRTGLSELGGDFAPPPPPSSSPGLVVRDMLV